MMKFPFKGKEYYIDGYLASTLNSIAYNLPNDWDIVIIVTGDRSVRVGKSVFAMTVCAYICYVLNIMKRKTDFTIDDVYFDNKVMVDEAQEKPKFAINLYDEGREGLAASKSVKQFQQDLVDFFTECGQLNQVFVIVAPDYFELKENIAVGRAEILMNVYRKETRIMKDLFKTGEKLPMVRFDRGFFEFFNRRSKQKLFDISKSKRQKNYHLTKADFKGRFTNQYPLDEAAYRKKKEDSLARFKERHKETRQDKHIGWRNAFIYAKSKQGLSTAQILDLLENDMGCELSPRSIRDIVQERREKEENPLENGVLEGKRASYTNKLTKSDDNDGIKV